MPETSKAFSADVIAPAESVGFGGESKAKLVDVCALVLWTWVRLPPAPPFIFYAALAQLEELLICTQWVRSSSLLGGPIF